MKKYREEESIRKNISFPIQYFFAINFGCLTIRISQILGFSESVGPLIKIVGKMVKDFYNFTLLFVLMAVMFTIVYDLNFTMERYKDFFNSFLTVFDASLGNYNFQDFYNEIK
jgi:hypothetical protein